MTTPWNALGKNSKQAEKHTVTETASLTLSAKLNRRKYAKLIHIRKLSLSSFNFTINTEISTTKFLASWQPSKLELNLDLNATQSTSETQNRVSNPTNYRNKQYSELPLKVPQQTKNISGCF